jgi:hypothetical protein
LNVSFSPATRVSISTLIVSDVVGGQVFGSASLNGTWK